MQEKFIELFKETAEIEDVEITLDTIFRDLDSWDSLTFLSIIAMLDEEYEVIIEGNDFKNLKTIGDLVNEVKKRE